MDLETIDAHLLVGCAQVLGEEPVAASCVGADGAEPVQLHLTSSSPMSLTPVRASWMILSFTSTLSASAGRSVTTVFFEEPVASPRVRADRTNLCIPAWDSRFDDYFLIHLTSF